MEKINVILLTCLLVYWQGQAQTNQKHIVIDDTGKTESIAQIIKIDSVWAGHPVGFSLLTKGKRQYIAYYNTNRNMVVGQRNLTEDSFSLHTLPATFRETSGGTSTVLGWDSHNYVTLGVDKDDFIHLSGNMHGHPITYFRSKKQRDISTLEQITEMVGTKEKRVTYPHFMISKEGELIYHYRDGGSGNGNEIYNKYSSIKNEWSRLLETPLTDGQGLMNAYQSQPKVMADGWYHVYWVWRDTPDCATNHDLSYMKSPDLKHWFNAFGDPIKLPVTLDKKSIIVDPIPVRGGIINLAAKLCLDEDNNPLFAYHKYDPDGNIQFYVSQISEGEWVSNQVTNWDYRWDFSGNGSINVEVKVNGFSRRSDGNFEIDYWHLKYGTGTILLDDKMKPIGEVLKADSFIKQLEIEGDFPGLSIKSTNDMGKVDEVGMRYLLKWETLNANRDRPRPKPWPKPSGLYLYKLKSK
ncbi:MAG: BNR repeat-containing protein [Maribacter sp.]|nr:BNR repeat-containing protein [Maribacter sp.]